MGCRRRSSKSHPSVQLLASLRRLVIRSRHRCSTGTEPRQRRWWRRWQRGRSGRRVKRAQKEPLANLIKPNSDSSSDRKAKTYHWFHFEFLGWGWFWVKIQKFEFFKVAWRVRFRSELMNFVEKRWPFIAIFLGLVYRRFRSICMPTIWIDIWKGYLPP